MSSRHLRAALARYMPHGTLAGVLAAAVILSMLAGATLTQTGCETVTACLSPPIEPNNLNMDDMTPDATDDATQDADGDAAASLGREALLEKFAGRLPGDVLARLGEKA